MRSTLLAATVSMILAVRIKLHCYTNSRTFLISSGPTLQQPPTHTPFHCGFTSLASCASD